MNLHTQNSDNILNGNNRSEFIHLKGNISAEYNIIYHINDIYSVKDLSKINDKHQLLFQKFSSKTQQLNLVLVDTIFPVILADLALETFLNKVTTIEQYTDLEKNFTVISKERDREYFKYKFTSFINYLLYSNIYSGQICNGDLDTDKIYYMKNAAGEIEYYPVFRMNELVEMVIGRMKVGIDRGKSIIKKDNVKLGFKIFADFE